MAAKVAAQVLEENGVDIRDNLEEAFYQMFTRETVSIEELWASLDDDDE
ncbi:MAG: hypothetical protein MUF38_06805 [Anaerolineae bacterium]|nr:hypothetical protein [Anaerolineae bacterium]